MAPVRVSRYGPRMTTPLACNLGAFSPAERARYDELRAALLAAAHVEPANGGYAVRLPGDDETFRAVAEWILLERRCCPFISFAISFGDVDEPLRVALTGDADVEDVLRTEFGSRVVLPAGSLVRR
jgi:hypothetical protein